MAQWFTQNFTFQNITNEKKNKIIYLRGIITFITFKSNIIFDFYYYNIDLSYIVLVRNNIDYILLFIVHFIL
jgi:hypothetical protein